MWSASSGTMSCKVQTSSHSVRHSRVRRKRTAFGNSVCEFKFCFELGKHATKSLENLTATLEQQKTGKQVVVFEVQIGVTSSDDDEISPGQ